jgi:hypothetical protein
MRPLLFVCILLCIYQGVVAQPKTLERPKLVVGIVVDQMRWDYLNRFYDRYGDKGFKRLLKGGYSCDQAMINYLPAYTAPGHACIYTGSVPSIHGISGNDWYDNQSKRYWYCVEDTNVTPVGGSRPAGRMSPNNLLTTTITDELRLATGFRSRVFGVALKDRGSILPAGHLANGAYWYDDSTGSFISSSYYGKELPGWLTAFNNQRLPDSFIRKDWNLLYPANTYLQSQKDDNPYEGNVKGEMAPVFPHKPISTPAFSSLRRVPLGNTYTFLAAKACIAGEELGSKGNTDFLCVSLSSTDYIGHQYGPDAMEVEDCYLRLDKDIADFLNYLDEKEGKGNYVVFLTADHGGAHNSIFLNDNRVHAGNLSETKTSMDLKAYLANEFNNSMLILEFNNYQVSLNEAEIRSSGVDRKLLKEKIKQWFLQQQNVAYVMDMEDMNGTPVPEPIRAMAINGYNRKRSGSILVVYDPGWYVGYLPTGTSHGTWHPYDTHIPMLFYGWNVPKGKTDRVVHMEDIAATMASLLHIQMPNGCVGKPVTEITNP